MVTLPSKDSAEREAGATSAAIARYGVRILMTLGIKAKSPPGATKDAFLPAPGRRKSRAAGDRSRPPALQDPLIIGPFKRCGVGTAAKIEGASELLDACVVMRLHPAAKSSQENGEKLRAVLQKRGDDLDHMRTGKDRLHNVVGGVDPAGCRQGAPDVSREYAEPAERHEPLRRIRQVQLGLHLQILDVHVRLIKPIEHDDARSPGLLEREREMRRRRMKCGQFDRD